MCFLDDLELGGHPTKCKAKAKAKAKAKPKARPASQPQPKVGGGPCPSARGGGTTWCTLGVRGDFPGSGHAQILGNLPLPPVCTK